MADRADGRSVDEWLGTEAEARRSGDPAGARTARMQAYVAADRVLRAFNKQTDDGNRDAPAALLESAWAAACLTEPRVKNWGSLLRVAEVLGDRDRVQLILPRCGSAEGLIHVAHLLRQLEEDPERISRFVVIARERALESLGQGEENWFLWGRLGSLQAFWLHDPEGARETVLMGLAEATTAVQVIWVARGWESDGQLSDAPDWLRREAEARARTLDDWLTLARFLRRRQNRAHALEREGLELALEWATELADGADIVRVARIRDAYASPSDYPVPPASLRPDEIISRNRVERVLAGWSPDPNALFDLLRPQLSTDGIRSIARADRGYRAAENQAWLESICQTGCVPNPLGYSLHEVCMLTRWSLSEDPVTLAFATTLLLIDEHGPRSPRNEEPANSVLPLVVACRQLGREALEALRGFLVALYEEASWAAHLLGLVLVQLELDPEDPSLPELIETLELAQVELGWWRAQRWLIDQIGALHPEHWEALCADVFARALRTHRHVEAIERLAYRLGVHAGVPPAVKPWAPVALGQ